MIKVLLIVHRMEKGGLETRLMDILRKWDFSDIQLDIYTSSFDKGYYDDEAIGLGCTLYYNPPLTIFNMKNYIYYFRDFLMKHPEYKIIHAHQDAWCSIYCRGAYKAGVPFRIAHSRTANTVISLKSVVRNIIKKPTIKYATHYFAVSRPAAQWLFGKRNLKQGLVRIWPNAIDYQKYLFNNEARLKMRRNLNIENRYVVMHVGNFTNAKNHDFILRVFEYVCKLDKNAILVLIGGGNREKYEKIVQKKHIEKNVLFLGQRNDVEMLLQAADVFLFPSKYEGLPGAVLEAQAAGLSCIVSDRVTDEIKITPLVDFLSLTDNVSEWGELVLSKKGKHRENTGGYFEKSGFSIHTLVLELQVFYKNLSKQRG